MGRRGTTPSASRPNPCALLLGSGTWHGRDLIDVASEVSETLEKSLDGFAPVASIEAIRPEVFVFDAVAHMK